MRAVAALALLVVACGSAPSPTPGDILAVRDELTVRGVTVISAVSGESACPGQPLHDNALHLTVMTVPDDGTPRDVYLYLFRARGFESTADQMDACVLEYRAALGDTAVSRVDVAPYRAIGAGWPDDLRRLIEDALAATTATT